MHCDGVSRDGIPLRNGFIVNRISSLQTTTACGQNCRQLFLPQRAYWDISRALSVACTFHVVSSPRLFLLFVLECTAPQRDDPKNVAVQLPRPTTRGS